MNVIPARQRTASRVGTTLTGSNRAVAPGRESRGVCPADCRSVWNSLPLSEVSAVACSREKPLLPR